MKAEIQSLLAQALDALRAERDLPDVEVSLQRSKDPRHGDYASNLALLLAPAAGEAPRRLAEALVAALPASEWLDRVEIAGPGFINFFLSERARRAVIARVLEQGEAYGRVALGAGRSVLIEFVSANPTGPLHVGHGRGAAYGAALAALLDAAGWRVEKEYYVNDAGRQMDILAVSTWLRYLERQGVTLPFPANGYRGDYVRAIAAALEARCGTALRVEPERILEGLPPDEADGGDKEAYIDALIARARTLLGAHYVTLFDTALAAMLEDIRNDLAEFGVHFDRWYHERELLASGAVERCLERLEAAGHLYERDGALWFASTRFGDEKDRVVRRENGQYTYFASDIAYHLEKFERGHDRLIDIWGADHHGYVPRVRAALAALGQPADKLEVLLVQFAVLYRGRERLSMSTRAGEFVTLRQLREEVGNDAARFFYIMRRADQHMDFDLELAKSQSQDNPVYYVQYAHARIASVFRQLEQSGGRWSAEDGLAALDRLNEPHERDLMTLLGRYPETIEAAAAAAEPHQIVYYLRELANAFHSYYNAHPFLVDDPALRAARLTLVAACGRVLRNALALIGVRAPERM